MEAKQMNLQVGGMTCAACSSRVERGLKKIDGVCDASVNLATEKAQVVYDPARVGTERFIEAIQNMGYMVKTENVTIPVGGMTCAACSARVERTLNKLEGVVEARVNLATEKASIDYLSGQIGIADLKNAISKLGYFIKEEVEEKRSEKGEKEEDDVRKVREARRRLIIAWVFTGPMMLIMGVMMAWHIHLFHLYHNAIMFILATPVVYCLSASNIKFGVNCVYSTFSCYSVLTLGYSKSRPAG